MTYLIQLKCFYYFFFTVGNILSFTYIILLQIGLLYGLFDTFFLCWFLPYILSRWQVLKQIYLQGFLILHQVKHFNLRILNFIYNHVGCSSQDLTNLNYLFFLLFFMLISFIAITFCLISVIIFLIVTKCFCSFQDQYQRDLASIWGPLSILYKRLGNIFPLWLLAFCPLIFASAI